MLGKNGIKHIERVESAVLSKPHELQMGLENLIVLSWARSLEKYELDPGRDSRTRILTHSELTSCKESREAFLRLSRAGMERLYQQVFASGYMVLLTDHEGVTIDSIGDPKHKKELKDAGLCEGALWAEHEEGTCGVGTCIATQQALTIHKGEHFRARHIDLTCTTVPIFDPQGKLLGVLDASALYSPDDKRSQSLVFHLVSISAKLIENSYFLREYQDDWILHINNRPEFAEVVTEHLLAFNFEGKIIAANNSSILHFNRKLDHGLIGRHISEIFDIKFAGLLDLFSKQSSPKFAIRSVDGTTYFASMMGPKLQAISSRNIKERTVTIDITDNISASKLTLDRLAGKDTQLIQVADYIRRIVNNKLPIILTGETGTGKEAFAQAIHDSSKRSNNPFIAVNCASIPETLIESELFGYKQGAFTGAHSKGMRGKILQSDSGTLFLDEIGDMPLQLQARLLRVLAEKEVIPLGSESPIPVDLNVVCATHRNLKDLVAIGTFREDLYYRLNGISLNLPALRERTDKLEIIASAIAAEAGDRYRELTISPEAQEFMCKLPWPGNIRQLRNALRFALAVNESGMIDIADLPHELTQLNSTSSSQATIEERPTISTGSNQNTMEQMEREALNNALAKHKWKITSAANELGISRSTIYRKMEIYNIVPPNAR
jgi:transcriptional regulator of acetoin/glycerol metabolism